MSDLSASNIHAQLRFVVIGAGMAGILAAIRLRQKGFSDVVIYEKADRLGGTWRDNTYPGVACDVPSVLYSYSFAPNPEWSHRFSSGPEIQNYLEEVACGYQIEQSIIYSEEVAFARHDGQRWHLRTSSGRTDVADVIIAATGVFHHPHIPQLSGLDTFAGDLLHTAKWDSSCDLAGRRIGIIGTGSSAVQTVGAVIDEVQHLTLFQRTAQWVLPQDNPSYSEAEKSSFRSNPESQAQLHDEVSELFADGFANAVVDANSIALAKIARLCRENLATVTDPELRAQLTPDHQAACKRLVVAEDFYGAIQRKNARVVTSEIQHIEPCGVLTVDQELHDMDILVMATGFRVDRFMRPMELVGPAGLRLSDAWAKRPKAYLSIAIPGLPNLFMLNGPNGPVGNFSLIEVAELQMEYILQLVDQIADGSCRLVEPSSEATDEYETARTKATGNTVWATGCNSWYLDDRGIPMAWPWTFREFRERMAIPDFSAYQLTS